VAIALALCTALMWGTMEVLLLRTAKAAGAYTLGLWLAILGGAILLPLALIFGDRTGPSDLAFALLPGLLGLAGSYLYWVALRVGKLAVVSPTVAASGGVAAVLAVALLGERFQPALAFAMAVSVLGIVLASTSGEAGATGAGWAAASALVLGLYTITLSDSAELVGALWSVTAYRVASLLVLVPFGLSQHRSFALPRAVRPWVVAGAILETLGFVAFVAALKIGPVALVSVLMAQFSTVAVVLAATVLRERLRPHQWVGVSIVLASVAVIAVLG
jgi:drug/metabolite transporter (DMT)-like permease